MRALVRVTADAARATRGRVADSQRDSRAAKRRRANKGCDAAMRHDIVGLGPRTTVAGWGLYRNLEHRGRKRPKTALPNR